MEEYRVRNPDARYPQYLRLVSSVQNRWGETQVVAETPNGCLHLFSETGWEEATVVPGTRFKAEAKKCDERRQRGRDVEEFGFPMGGEAGRWLVAKVTKTTIVLETAGGGSSLRVNRQNGYRIGDSSNRYLRKPELSREALAKIEEAVEGRSTYDFVKEGKKAQKTS